jgi:hypothetical protein
MRIGRPLLNWIEIRAWKMLAGWSRIDLDTRSLPGRERWAVVRAVVPAVIKSRYLRPARLWLLAHTPSRLVALRLHRRVHGWYQVPTWSAAEHVRLRFDIWPIELGDHLRLEGGRLTAIAYSTAIFSEIIFVEPNGELEPDPISPEMDRAWAAHNAARQ